MFRHWKLKIWVELLVSMWWCSIALIRWTSVVLDEYTKDWHSLAPGAALMTSTGLSYRYYQWQHSISVSMYSIHCTCRNATFNPLEIKKLRAFYKNTKFYTLEIFYPYGMIKVHIFIFYGVSLSILKNLAKYQVIV